MWQAPSETLSSHESSTLATILQIIRSGRDAIDLSETLNAAVDEVDSRTSEQKRLKDWT